MAHRDTVKPYFQTHDEPTQTQFYELFDKIRFIDDPIALADIAGLISALSGKLNTADYEGQLVAYNAPATYVHSAGILLEKIIPFYGGVGSIFISRIGMGQSEIFLKDDMVGGWNNAIAVDIFSDADMNIYIDGIPAGSKILFLKRKLKLV
jgi:hypothetical protein